MMLACLLLTWIFNGNEKCGVKRQRLRDLSQSVAEQKTSGLEGGGSVLKFLGKILTQKARFFHLCQPGKCLSHNERMSPRNERQML